MAGSKAGIEAARDFKELSVEVAKFHPNSSSKEWCLHLRHHFKDLHKAKAGMILMLRRKKMI